MQRMMNPPAYSQQEKQRMEQYQRQQHQSQVKRITQNIFCLANIFVRISSLVQTLLLFICIVKIKME